MSDDQDPAELVAAEAIQSLEAQPEIPEAFRKVSDPKKIALLVALSTTPNMGAACRAAGITPRTLYNWTHKDDTDFNAAFAVARDLGIKAAEAEAWKRATDGTVEDVYGSLGQGLGSGVVGQRRVKSDTMLIFMLKGAAPHKYRENTSHEISGPNGGPIQIEAVRSIIVDPKQIDG